LLGGCRPGLDCLHPRSADYGRAQKANSYQQCSRFAAGQPIRGGIPVIFPWFGKPADRSGQSGFARLRDWELKEMAVASDGAVSVRLQMPECADSAECPACAADYLVTVSDTLTAELVIMNRSAREFAFEDCLHTYFTVGDIGTVNITGLKGVGYFDHVGTLARKTDVDDAIRIASEVEHVYLNAPHTVEIHDGSLKRTIRVEQENRLQLWLGIHGLRKSGRCRISATRSINRWSASKPATWRRIESRYRPGQRRV